MAPMPDARLATRPGDYGWISQLLASDRVEPVTSAIRIRRSVASIGENATRWGIEAGRRMAAYIFDTLPDWPGDRSDEEVEALRRATEASTLDTLVALVTGDRTQLSRSVEPVENVAYYVSRSIPLEDLIHNVHAGQEFLTQALLDAIARFVPEAERVDVIVSTTRDVIACWSLFARHVTLEYAREHERWSASLEGKKYQVVRQLLAGTRTLAPDAERVLRYPLESVHTGVAIWLSGVELEAARLFDFAALAGEIARVCGCRSAPLVVAGRGAHAEMWMNDCADQPARLLRAHAGWPSGLRLAVGGGHPGVDGFRVSHDQARAAMRVLRLSEKQDQIVDYASVELISLLTADLSRARSFVRTTLGPLSAADPKSAELRRTLAAWIDSVGNVAATAQATFTHRNTVTYRLHQIDEILGPDRDNTRVRCALEIAAVMPGAVLVHGSTDS